LRIEQYYQFFGKKYPLISPPSFTFYNEFDEVTKKLIKNKFKIDSPYIIFQFTSDEINNLRHTNIESNYRFFATKKIIILEKNKKLKNQIIEIKNNISTIANKKDDNNTQKELYRYNFSILNKIIYNYFEKEFIKSDIIIIPLRSGVFFTESLLFPNKKLNNKLVLVESKRLDQENRVAISDKLTIIKKFDNKHNIIIYDAGLVTGITIISLMKYLELLGCKNYNLYIYSIYSTLYGILNIFHISKIFHINIFLRTIIVNFEINDDLRAIYDNEGKKILATGDVGDMLTIDDKLGGKNEHFYER
jgi:uracil phosphoribosyltransferase